VVRGLITNESAGAITISAGFGIILTCARPCSEAKMNRTTATLDLIDLSIINGDFKESPS
jgi:hypothetical protein